MKPRFARLAVIGVVAASFALAGCGRKGALDPPPGAAATSEKEKDKKPGSQQKNALNPIGAREKTESTGGFDADGKPVAPANGPKKRLPMDWLLD